MSNESADEQQQFQVKPRSFMMSRPGHTWEDGNGIGVQGVTNTIPRSPLAHDRSNTFSSQRVKTSVSDQYGRRSVATTYAGLPAARSTSNRQPKDRSVSATLGRPRSPLSSSPCRFFLTVIPPVDLPQDPPHPRSQASAISISHTRRGTLLPLYPTLGGQLYAISREYGLPSIGGISLYLCDDGDGNLGPRVGDVAWSALWNRYFDEAAEDLYQNITSPLPSRSVFREQSHDRQYSGSSGEAPSPFADRSSNLRREVETGIYDDATFLRYELDRRPSSSAARLPPFASGYSASPTAPYHTPSPRYAKGTRTASRSSPYTPSNTQARLPIVGRIEWAVDKKRALWWSNWIGEAELAGDRSISNIEVPIAVDSHTTEIKPKRRSMHLRTDVLPARATSPLRSIPIQGSYDEDTEKGNSSVRELYKETRYPSRSQEGSGEDVREMGYQPIDGEEQVEDVMPQAQAERADSRNSVERETEAQGHSHDAQSYAGYSALLEADEEARTRYEESIREGDINREAINRGDMPRFNTNLLHGDDGRDWRQLHHDLHTQNPEKISLTGPSDVTSPTRNAPGETSAVHEWIVKTHSPRSNILDNGYLNAEEDGDEEALLPPQDDMEEVLGLWAQKMGSNGAPLPELTHPQGEGEKRALKGQSASHHSQSASLTSSNYSVERSSPRSSRQPQYDHNEYDHMVKMGELPEKAPMTNVKEVTINKASLLSPIALDGASGTFFGPSANLGSLLPGRSNLAPNIENRQNTLDSVASSSVRSVTTRLKENEPTEQHSLSSPRLEIPDPHSPGAHSHHSSVTDVSDTLLDMERALELLSPSLSNNHHGSPAVNTADTTYEAGSITSFTRAKIPFISSRESMARAKTLSTSVTPSPRWFRTGNNAINTQVNQSSTAALHSRIVSAYEDRRVQQDQSSTSTRPMSASAASMKSRSDSGDLLSQSASDRFLGQKVEIDDRKSSVAVSQSLTSFTPVVVDKDLSALMKQESKVVDPTVDEGQEGKEEAEKSSTAKLPHLYTDSESIRMYDSPVEIEGMRPQWLHPGEHLRKQGWSDSTIDHSSKQVPSRYPSHMQQSFSSEAGNEYDIDRVNHHRLESIDAMFSPRSGEYATVGVQAEREEGRAESLFSLVSDEAAQSEMSVSNQGTELEDETANTTMAMQTETKSPVHSLDNAELTPVLPSKGHMQQYVSPGKEDVQPSIQRLLRGNSFAASSVASSKAASVVNSPDESEQQLPDWRNGVRSNGLVGNSTNDITNRQGSNLYQMMTQRGEGDEELMSQDTDTNVDEIAEVTKIAKDLSESDSGHGGEWTYEGSEFDENRFDTEEYEGEGTGDSPATTRISRMSGYSHAQPVNGAGLSDAEGRTPTFYYDQHLADDEDLGSRHRLSKISKASQSPSHLHNKAPTFDIAQRKQSFDVKSWHLHDQQSPIKAKKDSVKGQMLSDTIDAESYDSSRHDIISMQGEPLNSSDDQMLKGFEQVSPDPAEMHYPMSGLYITDANHKVEVKSEHSASSMTETALSLSPFPTQQQSPQTPSLQFDQADTIMTRRSLGSVGEDNKAALERDASPLRRASGSATSPYTRSASFTTSPRRFKGAMLRLASNISNTSSSNGQATVSSRGNSPNQRFGALPPSPSLPGLGSNGIMMSPTHSYTGTRSTSGGTLHSPTLTSTFMIRNANSPPFDKTNHLPPSPAFKFPRTAGTLSPPSPNGLLRQVPLAKNTNIVNT